MTNSLVQIVLVHRHVSKRRKNKIKNIFTPTVHLYDLKKVIFDDAMLSWCEIGGHLNETSALAGVALFIIIFSNLINS